jgi:hypothetical protein
MNGTVNQIENISTSIIANRLVVLFAVLFINPGCENICDPVRCSVHDSILRNIRAINYLNALFAIKFAKIFMFGRDKSSIHKYFNRQNSKLKNQPNCKYFREQNLEENRKPYREYFHEQNRD